MNTDFSITLVLKMFFFSQNKDITSAPTAQEVCNALRCLGVDSEFLSRLVPYAHAITTLEYAEKVSILESITKLALIEATKRQEIKELDYHISLLLKTKMELEVEARKEVKSKKLVLDENFNSTDESYHDGEEVQERINSERLLFEDDS